MRWPAKAVQTQTAAKNADKIRSAFKKAFDSEAIAKAWLETHLGSVHTTPEMARDWAKVHVTVNKQPLLDVFPQMYAEGYVIGEKAASYVLAHKSMNKKANNVGVVDWNTWKPGDSAASALLKPKGSLRTLLDSKGITIDGVSNTKVDRIGTILSKSLAEGVTVKDTSLLIDQVIDDPQQALAIAMTETARAVSMASRDLYESSGVEMVEWLADDACDLCMENADASPIGIDEVFPSEDTEPPAHPNCTCSLSPADVSSYSSDGEQIDTLDLSASADLVKFVPSKLEVERALSRLKILPNPPGEEESDRIEIAWEMIDPITVDPNIWDKAQLVIVNLKDLTATDTFLDKKRLKKHIKSMGQAITDYRAYPLVVERDDKQIIIDGHHRLMAQWLLGQDTAPVWLATEN